MANILGNVINIKDYMMSINDLGKPTVYDMSDITPGKMNSVITLLGRLLLLKKGTYLDHPDLGIDIRSKYKFIYEDELYKLKADIENQVSTYLPEFLPINVTIEFQTINKIRVIVIYITIDQTLFEITYDPNTFTITGLAGG